MHGDFLFDNIKNTVSELETLEDNMKEKFRQYASEYGMIVLGYSGNNRSVMDNLNLLLRSDTNFPHGIYWCVKKGAQLGANVDRLTRYLKFKIVEIDGFDEFFASVQQALGLELQPEMSDPYGSLVNRLNSLIKDVKIPTPGESTSLIERDIKLIGKKISQLNVVDPDKDSYVKLNIGDRMINMPIPFQMLAQIETRSGNYEGALAYLLRELAVRPSLAIFERAFSLLCKEKLFKFQDELMQALRKSINVLERNPNTILNISVNLIKAGLYDLAEEALELGYEASKSNTGADSFSYNYYLLNRYQIKSHRGESFTEQEKSHLAELAKDSDLLTRMGASILLEHYNEASLLLDEALKTEEVDDSVYEWPIMKFLKAHLDQTKLIEEGSVN